MRVFGLLVLALWTAGCATNAGSAGRVSDAKASVMQAIHAFEGMNSEQFQQVLRDDVTGYDFALDGKPVRLNGRAEARRFADETFAGLKQMGGTLSFDIHSLDCQGDGHVAYCTSEFDMTVTMKDGKTMLMPTRNTFVLRNGSDGWKWVHWQSAAATAPAQ